MHSLISINWRMVWYSVLVWIVAFASSGFIILPWFYFVFPGLIFILTIAYFRKLKILGQRLRGGKQIYFATGISIGLTWFCMVAVFDLIQLFTLNDFSFSVFFMDPRNFIKYPVIILLPAIYGLIVENGSVRQKAKVSFQGFVEGLLGLEGT